MNDLTVLHLTWFEYTRTSSSAIAERPRCRVS